MTSEKEMLLMLNEHLEVSDESWPTELTWQCKNVRTFEDAGVLTSNTGLVINLKDGSQFQITIVKSR